MRLLLVATLVSASLAATIPPGFLSLLHNYNPSATPAPAQITADASTLMTPTNRPQVLVSAATAAATSPPAPDNTVSQRDVRAEKDNTSRVALGLLIALAAAVAIGMLRQCFLRSSARRLAKERAARSLVRPGMTARSGTMIWPDFETPHSIYSVSSS